MAAAFRIAVLPGADLGAVGMAGGVCFVAGVIWAAVLMFSDT
jgi:hypothetical protein